MSLLPSPPPDGRGIETPAEFARRFAEQVVRDNLNTAGVQESYAAAWGLASGFKPIRVNPLVVEDLVKTER